MLHAASSRHALRAGEAGVGASTGSLLPLNSMLLLLLQLLLLAVC
eukprot:COSAG02_NODE_22339_length_755_cov_10.018293_2_plen_44_part_01